MLTRRTILKATTTIGAVTAVSGTWGAAKALAQTPPLRVRRSLEGMALDDPDLETYRDFVGIMLAKNQNEPVSWLQYSLLHGRYPGPYKYCPHGDWYFLPWHREYTLMYENAARVLTGNDSFAMPYWNWTNQRLMPEAFADPTYNGQPNPLYVANRNELVGQYALTDDIVGPQLFTLPGDPNYSSDSVYWETYFELFGTSRNPAQDNLDMSWVVRGGGTQGTLERMPHNMVHNNIGAYMPTAGSPRDPVFFMHHSHIDGIWARWNALGRKNSSDYLWLDMEFTENYLTPTGQLYSKTVNELESTEALGYTYDDVPGPVAAAVDEARNKKLAALFSTAAGSGATQGLKMQRLSARGARVGSAVEPLRAMASISQPAVEALQPEATQEPGPEVFALIRGITIGPKIHHVEVFVNHPDLQHHVTEEDPRYVTTFSFLRHPMNHNKEKPSVVVDLTNTLKRLKKLGLLRDDHITVQLIPVAESGVVLEDTEPVTVESIEIVVL